MNGGTYMSEAGSWSNTPLSADADSNGQNMAAAFMMGEGMGTSYRWTDFRLPGKLAEGQATNLLSDKPSGGDGLIWRLEQSLAAAWGKRVGRSDSE